MRILAITGAGCSAESGSPTYRGPNGLYNDVDDPERLMSAKGLRNVPYHAVECIRQLVEHLENLKPSAIHFALSELEKEHEVLIATQNVDGLHQAAGSTKVCELHGSIERNVIREGHEIPDVVLFGDPVKPDALYDAYAFTKEPVDQVWCIGTTMNFPYLWDLVFGCRKARTILIDIDSKHHYRALFDEHIQELRLPNMGV